MTDAALADRTDELDAVLDGLDATLVVVRREVGRGLVPELARRLDGHVRSLRAVACADTVTLAEDVVDLAKRTLETAIPDATLMMLTLAQQRLHDAVERQHRVHARAA